MAETTEELSKLRVVDLKQRLAELDLPIGGLKADLVERLHQHLTKKHEEEEVVEEEEVGEGSSEDSSSSSDSEEEQEAEEKQQPQADDAVKDQPEPILSSPPRPQSVDPSSATSPPVAPPPLMQSLPPAPIVPKPMAATAITQPPPSVLSPVKQGGVDPDVVMQHKVRQQQMLLQQQKNTQEQEELFRLQQQALLEKQKEETEKQAHLLRLQQEALKQNQDEEKQLQALGLTPPPPQQQPEESMPPGNSGVAGVGALMAALRQQQPAPAMMAAPPSTAMMVRPPALSATAGAPPLGAGGVPPLRPPPPMPQQHRPPPPPHEQLGIMGHSPVVRPPPSVSPPSLGGRLPTVLPTGHMGGGGPPPARQPPQPLRRQVGRGDDKPPPLMSLQVTAPKTDPKDVRLPQALEEALAFKHQRAKQVGVTLDKEEEIEIDEHEPEDEYMEGENEEDAAEDVDMEFNPWAPASFEMADPTLKRTGEQEEDDTTIKEEADDEDEDDDDGDELEKHLEIICSKSGRKDKLKKKKKKKKKKKAASGGKTWIQKQLEEERLKREETSKKKKTAEIKVDVSYVQEQIELDYSDPLHRHFAKVFENFKISEPLPAEDDIKMEEKTESSPMPPVNLGDLKKVPKLAEDPEDDSDNENDGKPKVSKRKLKLMRRMSIAELKQTVTRPDVVEMHDVTARDPKLLVHLKATRNTVSVPRHWCFKRKYLQGKRGIEKPPFELPDFIKRTGIMEMRAALQEKEDQKTLKAKMREKVRPKMGKIDIDYQKLHDAFFKWQCKPEMTIHGDLYYEGKEFETKMKDKKPGEMSDDLRIALGMPVGANAHKVPPPWLIAMQRYGPPPSYPNLKIPGLNGPIPEGCSFGYHAGGWGKPPVDNMGKPIYGDVFGTQNKENDMPMVEEEVEKSLWGELESESEEESEEEETSDEEDETSGLVTPGETGLVTPSGISSLPAGLETPDMIELRKKHMETEMEGGETPALYTILPEKPMEGGPGRAMMGSSHTYDLSSAMGGGANRQGVEVALDPSELDLVDTDAMAARYEATLREQHGGDDEDFSDMVAEHAAKQRNKRRRLQQQDQNKPTKKYKDFKF